MTFMREYESATKPLRARKGWRLWRGVVTLRVTASGGRWIYLQRIAAIKSGRGDGSRCLDWLIDLARKHDKIIYGHASNDFAGKVPKPKVMQLRRWYREHGAKFDRRGGFTINWEG